MFSFADLLWLALLGCGALYLWSSGQYKARALDLAFAHCQKLGLQLLDHSMVIRALWPVRNADGKLVLRRRYSFEFASTGDRRYQGVVILLGLELEHIEVEAYKLPPGD